jgi:hypothetical protein
VNIKEIGLRPEEPKLSQKRWSQTTRSQNLILAVRRPVCFTNLVQVNNIGVDGAKAIAELLKSTHSITELNLCCMLFNFFFQHQKGTGLEQKVPKQLQML